MKRNLSKKGGMEMVKREKGGGRQKKIKKEGEKRQSVT